MFINDDTFLLLLYAAPGFAVLALLAWLADQLAHCRALRRYHRGARRRPAATRVGQRPDGAPGDY